MSVMPYQYSTYQSHPSFGSRATSIALSVGVVALIVLMLLKMGVFPQLNPLPKSRTISLQLLPGSQTQATRSQTVTRTRSSSRSAAKVAPHHTASANQAPTPHVPLPWNVTPLSGDEFAASDISTKPSRSSQQMASADTGAGAGSGTGAGQGNGAASGQGEGPNGETLFNADWERKPTDQELDYYLPNHGANLPDGAWALIACKTIPGNRVEDCHELGESPGSRLAGAVRQAAWQFRILPPRVNGKPIIGAWVKIYYYIGRGLS